jgi:hypothetical protein
VSRELREFIFELQELMNENCDDRGMVDTELIDRLISEYAEPKGDCCG